MKRRNISFIKHKTETKNSNSLIMMRGNMNHIINISHYSLIERYVTFYFNFSDGNTCVKIYNSYKFSQYKTYRLTPIQLLTYRIIC